MKLYNNKFQKSLPMLLLALVMIPSSGFSQEKKSAIAVQAGANFTSFDYNYNNQKVTDQQGFQLGLEYNYKLNPSWSVGIGVSYLTLDSKLHLKQIEGSYNSVDIENDAFEFKYKATNISEKVKTEFIQIPIFVRYEGAAKTTYYVQAGMKFTFAIKGTYKQSIENLKTSGYYPEYNVELNNLLVMGFGDFGSQSSSGKLNVETTYAANIEAGLKHQFNNNKPIYIGLFFDYGLNNMLTKSNKELVTYQTNNPSDLNIESVSNSQFAEMMRISSLGIKLKYTIW